MKELEYPFDSGYIMKKKRSLKKRLAAENTNRLHKKIAVLGGSTTADIVSVLDLFLLDEGIECEFYESEYAAFRRDALFPDQRLIGFKPDIVYIHTGFRNLQFLPSPKMSRRQIDEGFAAEAEGFEKIWDSISQKFSCPVIQNNFELPFFRAMGNSEASDYRGKINYVTRVNTYLYEAAAKRENLFINDINWLSAMCGLEKWSAPEYWYMYKYSLNINCIPDLCHQLCAVIKSIFGRNKKVLALDLDNTLWGGVVGDDGADNLVIGQETAEGMAFYEWQEYVKSLKDIGVLLTVCSKNEEENALAGLSHAENVLTPKDFAVIKANWLPKDENILKTADELNILCDSIVFADDNPAEREIVRSQLDGVKVPEMGEITDFIRVIDRSQFFEVTSLSQDDLRRSEMYRENVQRTQARAKYESYEDYLKGLEMKAQIAAFKPMYFQRIAQLANKSNQFNLTTRRYTAAQIEEIAGNSEYITLYGRLSDRFGDNGVVSVVIGKIIGDSLDIELWLMSCRVLKRDMELAMLDELVRAAAQRGVTRLVGRYIPTAKNKMVARLYPDVLGFEDYAPLEGTAGLWTLDISGYRSKNKVIEILKEAENDDNQ